MAEYIEREAVKAMLKRECSPRVMAYLADEVDKLPAAFEDAQIAPIPAADVRPMVVCADCKHNNACLTQAFVEDASRLPFDRNTFFCADGKRADDA